ncbi:MAG: DUF3515 domain-containing protein [Marmoricola sp.]
MAVTAAASASLLVACGSSVPSTPNVAPFTQTAGAAAPCTAIMAALPKTLNHQARVKSTGSAFGAAWGNPAIVLRCGVPVPAGFAAENTPAGNMASCLTVNGIDWFLNGDSSNGADPSRPITVTTVYRSPALELTVPASYGTQGPSTAMALLTSVIRDHTKASKRCV